MKIEVVKHFQPEDVDFYGDFYVTVEVEGEVLITYFKSNDDEALAFAEGYAWANVKMGKNVFTTTISKADAEFETD